MILYFKTVIPSEPIMLEADTPESIDVNHLNNRVIGTPVNINGDYENIHYYSNKRKTVTKGCDCNSTGCRWYNILKHNIININRLLDELRICVISMMSF